MPASTATTEQLQKVGDEGDDGGEDEGGGGDDIAVVMAIAVVVGMGGCRDRGGDSPTLLPGPLVSGDSAVAQRFHGAEGEIAHAKAFVCCVCARACACV